MLGALGFQDPHHSNHFESAPSRHRRASIVRRLARSIASSKVALLLVLQVLKLLLAPEFRFPAAETTPPRPPRMADPDAVDQMGAVTVTQFIMQQSGNHELAMVRA